MKKIVLILLLFFVANIYGQDKSNQDIEVLKIESIDNIGKHHLISCSNEKGKKYLLWVDKVNRKTNRKNCKNENAVNIKVGQQYTFNFKKVNYNIGFLETGELYIGDKLIWSKEKSDFDVYRTDNLQGLYYLKYIKGKK
ncbi:conserved exported protein of unknown function [Tenacibaculum sp. 190130A14a]|uniref:Lipoprotein n=1 Tax=Tenacibaculum polynesiense TaxID=3137857 RepID=A0ABM9P757_9FLAO